MQITDDEYRDRWPKWSPDGARLAFVSTRTGNYQIFTVNKDGTDLRQLTTATGSLLYPIWSPDGTRMAYYTERGNYVIDPARPWKDQVPAKVPDVNESGDYMDAALSWSGDGQRLVGRFMDARTIPLGFVTYAFDTHKYTIFKSLVSAQGTGRARWLSDNRRVLVSAPNVNGFVVLDTQTGRIRESSIPGVQVGRVGAISKDDRQIYFTVTTSSSDLWMITLN